jgi:hypothetical protein
MIIIKIKIKIKFKIILKWKQDTWIKYQIKGQ